MFFGSDTAQLRTEACEAERRAELVERVQQYLSGLSAELPSIWFGPDAVLYGHRLNAFVPELGLVSERLREAARELRSSADAQDRASEG